MIKIDKGLYPKILDSEKVKLANEQITNFYSRKSREQKRYSFHFDKAVLNELKEVLHERFHGKCGYCEILIPSHEYGTIDRFRPHNGVRDNKNYFKDLYWWLAYDWDNLIYSCQECNQYKANYFPIDGKRALNKDNDLEKENKLLLNPCIDNPNHHISYDDKTGKLIGLTNIGEQTIQLLRLNRENLNEERRKVVNNLINDYYLLEDNGEDNPSSITLISNSFNADKPFLLAKYAAFRKNNLSLLFSDHLSNIFQLPKVENIGVTDEKTIRHFDQNTYLDNTYFPIENIEISNFKNISKLKLSYSERDKEESWLFLLGENGVGKSSLLQAIAIGLKPTYKDGDQIISNLVRKGKHKAIIRIKERNSSNIIETVLIRKDNKIKTTGKFNSYLIGYGSYRLMQQGGLKPEKAKNGIRYQNLFEPTKSLHNVLNWLTKIQDNNPKQFEIIATSLLKLLPNQEEDRKLKRKGKEIIFSDKPGVSLSLYSEGYKSVIALALDIMITLSNENADMDKLTGIVIIDEIGNQLHPSWQMQIVKKMREIFPLIQFIVSSHSPLCLRGVKKGEVVLLQENENGDVIANTELPSPAEFTIEQLLKSDFFGLHSTFDSKEEIEYKEYYNLINKKETANLTDEEKEKYNFLFNKFKPKEVHTGSSLRDELMYEVIDQLLAKQYNPESEKLSRDELKKKTLELIKKAWNNID